MSRRLACAVLLLTTLAACPSPTVERDAGTEPTDGGVEGSADGYCEAIVDFFCAFYVRCGRMAVADEAACRPVFLEACNARYEPTYAALEAAGLLTLSADGLAQCRDHLESAACEQVQLEMQGPCAALWEGTQGAGEACAFDVESFTCAPGTACVVDLSLCGVCEPVVADGERCAGLDVTCGAESFCNEPGVCAARKRAGEECGVGDRCVLGTTCTDGQCVGPTWVQLGDACDFDSRCPYASRCIEGTCVATVALDEACGPPAPCDSGYCQQGTCVPLLAEGESCSEAAQCASGGCAGETCATHPSVCFNP